MSNFLEGKSMRSVPSRRFSRDSKESSNKNVIRVNTLYKNEERPITNTSLEKEINLQLETKKLAPEIQIARLESKWTNDNNDSER